MLYDGENQVVLLVADDKRDVLEKHVDLHVVGWVNMNPIKRTKNLILRLAVLGDFAVHAQTAVER